MSVGSNRTGCKQRWTDEPELNVEEEKLRIWSYCNRATINMLTYSALVYDADI